MNKTKIASLTAACIAVVFLTSAMLPAPTSTPPGDDIQVENFEEDLIDSQPAPTLYNQTITAYLFWGEGCPHCAAEKNFLNSITNKYPLLEIKSYEIYHSQENRDLMARVAQKCGSEVRGVPAFVIGQQYIEGYFNDETTGRRIETEIQYCLKNNCPDPLLAQDNNQCVPPEQQEQSVEYLFFGKLDLHKLSLPVLTVVIGTLDGFNPCSMWALIMLITLLINTNSKKKMWIIGGVFILASALSYFLFLTAWLNLFLFIGILKVTRLIVGALAIFAGFYFLRDYWRNRKSDGVTCQVTTSKTKSKIIARIQKVTESNSFWAIVIGTVLIAFTVNMVELLCSVGLPTVYTRILTLSDLPGWQYYGYLGLYDFFYMLDDIIILIIAGITFRLFAGNQKYAKYSHLIGGILILILGLILIINPNLLMLK